MVDMIDYYKELFEKNKENLESGLLLDKIRQKGLKDFVRMGFPGNKMEKWKNFNTKSIQKNRYQLNSVEEETKLDFFSKISGLESPNTIVFNNGQCSYDFQIEEYKNGVIFGSIKAVLAKYPEKVLKFFNKANKQNLNGFNAMNSAFVQDGFFLYVPKNTKIDFPVLVTQNYNKGLYQLINNRNIIILEDNAACEVVQIESSDTGNNAFANNITEIFLGQNAQLTVNKLQKYVGNTIVIESSFIKQKTGSKYYNNIATIGGNKLRNDIHAKLEGTNCFANINGAFILDENNEVDNNVYIDHATSDCDSNQNFKGILDGKSKGAFTGYVLVRQDSQRTNAYQSNKNIVLSETANISTNPFLEIYADDVKCSHGASIGKLDQNAIFFLRARGISEEKSKELLLSAFALEAFKGIANTKFKNVISKEIEKILLKE